MFNEGLNEDVGIFVPNLNRSDKEQFIKELIDRGYSAKRIVHMLNRYRKHGYRLGEEPSEDLGVGSDRRHYWKWLRRQGYKGQMLHRYMQLYDRKGYKLGSDLGSDLGELGLVRGGFPFSYRPRWGRAARRYSRRMPNTRYTRNAGSIARKYVPRHRRFGSGIISEDSYAALQNKNPELYTAVKTVVGTRQIGRRLNRILKQYVGPDWQATEVRYRVQSV